MPINQSRHQWAKQVFLDAEWQGDRSICEVLRHVVEQTTESHTLKSRKFSLLTLIKREIDPIVKDWLHRNSYAAEWQFSDLVIGKYSVALVTLELLGRQGRPDEFCSDVFSRTCDCLISFMHFCQEHPSNYCKTVKLEPGDGQTFDECNERDGRGAKHRVRAKTASAPVEMHLASHYSGLIKAGLCVACGQPTQSEEERAKWIAIAFHQSTKDQLKTGKQFFSENRGSLEYCHEHAENASGSAAAKRAREWRGRFLSLLRAMERREISPALDELFPPDENLEFACRAIRNKKSHVKLRAIEAALPLLLSRELSEKEPAKTLIIESIRNIFFDQLNLVPKPFDRNAFLDSLTIGHSDYGRVLNATAFGMFPIIVTPAERE